MWSRKLVGVIVFGFAMLVFCHADAAGRFAHRKSGVAHETAVHTPKASGAGLSEPAHPGVKSSAPAKSVQRLPDLRIQNVRLDRGNHIVFELKNAGPGAAAPSLRANARVRLNWRGGHRDFGLKTVDPHGALTRPGGSVRFATPIQLKSPQRVMVALMDGTRRRLEKNSGNNTLSRLLTPKIVAVAGHAASEAHRPAAKIPKLAAGSRHKASTRHLQNTGSSKAARRRPQLAIEKIFMQNGNVYVRLKNSGRMRLGKEDITAVRLTVVYGTQTRSWPLTHIDRRHHLMHPDSHLNFDTGLAATTPTRVVARLEKSGNTRARTVVLYPRRIAAGAFHGGKAKNSGKAHKPSPLQRASKQRGPQNGGRLGGQDAKAPGNLAKLQPSPSKTQAKKLPNRQLPGPFPAPGPGGSGTPGLFEMGNLAVTDIDVTPSHPRALKDITTIRVTVKNIGVNATAYRCSLMLDVYSCHQNGTDNEGEYNSILPSMASLNIPILDPGEEVQISHTITFRVPGYHNVHAMLILDATYAEPDWPDPARHVSGTNLGNDEKVIMVGQRPDPSDLVLDKVERSSDGRLKISMHNSGAAIPARDYYSYIKVTFNNGTSRDMAMNELDPNGLLRVSGVGNPSIPHVSYIWPARTGIHYQDGIDPSQLDESTVRVELNYNRSITESNHWNNIIEKHFSANPANQTQRVFGNLPDLALCAYKTQRCYAGGEYPFMVTVKNWGPGPAPASRLVFWVEGKGTQTFSIPPLASCASLQIMRKVRFDQTGQRRFTATIDAAPGQVEELREDNNQLEGHIEANGPSGMYSPYNFTCADHDNSTCNPPSPGYSGPWEQRPDLVVCMKKYNHLPRLSTTTFPLKVKNIGQTPSVATKLSFHVGGNGTSHHNIPPLQPGEEYTAYKTFTWVTSGTNHFTLFVDYENKVAEWGENDNILRGVIKRGGSGTNSLAICSDAPDAATPVQ